MAFDPKPYEERAKKESWIRREPVAVDDFLNASTGGNLDETISARAWRWSGKKHGFFFWRDIAKGLNWALNKIQPDHGPKAASGDIERAKEVIAIEETALKDAKE